MKKQQQHFQIQGMQQDLSVAKFPSNMAFEINNMRITIDKNNSLLAISKEKGTSKIQLYSIGGLTPSLMSIQGVIIGLQEINEQCVIFSTLSNTNSSNPKKDFIYLLYYFNSSVT